MFVEMIIINIFPEFISCRTLHDFLKPYALSLQNPSCIRTRTFDWPQIKRKCLAGDTLYCCFHDKAFDKTFKIERIM